jgi:co-chaperonin GroES (HSP10)
MITVNLSNTSGLKARGHSVLVEPYEPEIKSSLLVIPDTVGDRTKMHEVRAVVVDIGACAWIDEPEPRAAIGDKVLISRFSGVLVRGTADQKLYRMVNDRDIFCQIEVEVVAS